MLLLLSLLEWAHPAVCVLECGTGLISNCVSNSHACYFAHSRDSLLWTITHWHNLLRTVTLIHTPIIFIIQIGHSENKLNYTIFFFFYLMYVNFITIVAGVKRIDLEWTFPTKQKLEQTIRTTATLLLIYKLQWTQWNRTEYLMKNSNNLPWKCVFSRLFVVRFIKRRRKKWAEIELLVLFVLAFRCCAVTSDSTIDYRFV